VAACDASPGAAPAHARTSVAALGEVTSSASNAVRTVASAPRRPVIVIDPGHSPSIFAIDRRTGLNVSDYENEPEMRDVFAVAVLVRKRLRAAGYRVIMTKKWARERVSLGRRAAIANRAHADLALSIHDQAGPNGGIRFDRRNNIVYHQSVGDYRATPSGKKIFFRDKHVAALSRTYGRVFRAQRRRAQRHHVTLRGNVGYNLGSRGLPAGDIWLVQLLSRVPWIYNEAGGNSAGRSGLDAADKRTYARGLVAAVEHCIHRPH
jgi:N-acetylmuramoyl-L-alanine amidase